jgi:hypothetical protein
MKGALTAAQEKLTNPRPDAFTANRRAKLQNKIDGLSVKSRELFYAILLDGSRPIPEPPRLRFDVLKYQHAVGQFKGLLKLSLIVEDQEIKAYIVNPQIADDAKAIYASQNLDISPRSSQT